LQAVANPSAVCRICGLSGSLNNRGASSAPLVAVEKLSFGSQHLASDCANEFPQLSNDTLPNEIVSDVAVPSVNDAVHLGAKIQPEDVSLLSAISESSSDHSKEDVKSVLPQLQNHTESECLTVVCGNDISEAACGKQLNKLQEGSESEPGCKTSLFNGSDSGFSGARIEKLDTVEQCGEDCLISCVCCGVSGM
jgi:hypothetical protein